MSAANFHPEIWKTPGFPPLLVCGSRWIHGDELTGAKRRDPKTGQVIHNAYQMMGHAVAIGLQKPLIVYLGFKDKDPSIIWDCTPPDTTTKNFPAELGGYSRKAAELALAEAWRGVEKYEQDPITRDLVVTFKPEKLTEYRGGSIMRNIFIWLSWDSWNRAGLTKDHRIEAITSEGFECTPKAFQHVLDDAGMSI